MCVETKLYQESLLVGSFTAHRILEQTTVLEQLTPAIVVLSDALSSSVCLSVSFSLEVVETK